MMKRKITVFMFAMVAASLVMAEGLIRPKTANDDLGTTTYPFGTIHATNVGDVTSSYMGSNGTFEANVEVKGTLTANTATIRTNATVGGTLGVTGNASFGVQKSSSSNSVAGILYANSPSGISLATNASIFAGQWTARDQLMVSTVLSNSPIGSLAVSGNGHAWVRVANSNPDSSNDWFAVTTTDAE